MTNIQSVIVGPPEQPLAIFSNIVSAVQHEPNCLLIKWSDGVNVHEFHAWAIPTTIVKKDGTEVFSPFTEAEQAEIIKQAMLAESKAQPTNAPETGYGATVEYQENGSNNMVWVTNNSQFSGTITVITNSGFYTNWSIPGWDAFTRLEAKVAIGELNLAILTLLVLGIWVVWWNGRKK